MADKSKGLSPFDVPPNRQGTRCEKWDFVGERFGRSERAWLPMWVADMDFRSPDAVQDAVERLWKHGVYGYYGGEAAHHAAVARWMRDRHNWPVEEDWVVSTNGLVNGYGLCIDTFSEPGDGVIVFTPVYHAFARIVESAGRRITEVPLDIIEGRFRMNFETAAAALKGNEKIVTLCSPHNPGGTVWRKQELEELASFARAHDLLIIADEIHHDIVFPGSTHAPLANVGGVPDRVITMTAASKTFNIAGARIGNVIIPNERLRSELGKRMTALGIEPGSFGFEMASAAYTPDGAAWLDELIDYLDANRQLFDAGVNQIPGVSSMPLEGTYLAWVDFRGTGLGEDDLFQLIMKRAGIAANKGRDFGMDSTQSFRFNLGTQRKNVEEAVERLHAAFGL